MQTDIELNTPGAPGAGLQRTPTRVEWISASELDDILPTLVDLLVDNVNAGASLGFLAPLARADALHYWVSIRGELHAGSRLLLVARSHGRVVGTGQLALPTAPSARHRTELQKLLVTPALKGLGIGRLLVAELHEAARKRGRPLITLCTRFGEPPVHFYKKLGYREVGVIPGYTCGPTGKRYDSMILCQDLAA